jgi:hypothetical protein
MFTPSGWQETVCKVAPKRASTRGRDVERGPVRAVHDQAQAVQTLRAAGAQMRLVAGEGVVRAGQKAAHGRA